MKTKIDSELAAARKQEIVQDAIKKLNGEDKPPRDEFYREIFMDYVAYAKAMIAHVIDPRRIDGSQERAWDRCCTAADRTAILRNTLSKEPAAAWYIHSVLGFMRQCNTYFASDCRYELVAEHVQAYVYFDIYDVD